MKSTHRGLPHLLDALLRVLRWHRRTLAAFAAAIAVFASLSLLQPSQPATTTAIVASKDLAPGTVLAASDMHRIEVPRDVCPSGSQADASAFVGKTINTPVSERTVLTDALVATGQALARPGYVVMSVPLPNASLAELLRPGTMIDILSPGKGVIASHARVVGSTTQAAGLGIGGSQRAILAEVSSDSASLIAAASQMGALTVAVR